MIIYLLKISLQNQRFKIEDEKQKHNYKTETSAPLLTRKTESPSIVSL